MYKTIDIMNSPASLPIILAIISSRCFLQTLFAEKGLQKTEDPYDNTCINSFHSLIKRKWLNRFSILNYEHAYRLIFEYVETFYYTVRIHSPCDYMSPDEFEK